MRIENSTLIISPGRYSVIILHGFTDLTVLMVNSACWNGSRIIFRQLSPEAEDIYDLIISLHQSCSGDWKTLGQKAGVPEQDVNHFLDYAAQFLGNGGNYKGFGDSKFLPRISSENLEKLTSTDEKANGIYKKLNGAIYSGVDNPSLLHLGYPDQGHLSNYYLGNTITQQEIEAISKTIAKAGILPENTRVRKVKDTEFELLIASGIDNPPSEDIDSKDGKKSLDINEDGVKGIINLKFGDYREEMAKIALEMKTAGKYAANDGQRTMIEQYAKSFGTGSLNAFKKSQEAWVKDIGPMVESNIGFIETYRDPAGVRAEWEGFGEYCMNKLLGHQANGDIQWQWSTKNVPELLGLWSLQLRNSYHCFHGVAHMKRINSRLQISHL